MNTYDNISNLDRKTVDQYVDENGLTRTEQLLEKDNPLSLMPLYVEQFGGVDIKGITTVEFLRGYKKFLEELRDIYGVEVKQTSVKRK